MASDKQRAAARRNLKKAQAGTKRKKTDEKTEEVADLERKT